MVTVASFADYVLVEGNDGISPQDDGLGEPGGDCLSFGQGQGSGLLDGRLTVEVHLILDLARVEWPEPEAGLGEQVPAARRTGCQNEFHIRTTIQR